MNKGFKRKLLLKLENAARRIADTHAPCGICHYELRNEIYFDAIRFAE
jgi:hypothetical protein